ncbi:MAG TPA: hypothetical protein EYP34_07845, partial [Chromatiaceae bacterium]|nr:hypothetical protein [Chromatiaceae bacterium]
MQNISERLLPQAPTQAAGHVPGRYRPSGQKLQPLHSRRIAKTVVVVRKGIIQPRQVIFVNPASELFSKIRVDGRQQTLLPTRRHEPGISMTTVCDLFRRFGPVIMVGLGGVFVEIIKDVAFAIHPITREYAL